MSFSSQELATQQPENALQKPGRGQPSHTGTQQLPIGIQPAYGTLAEGGPNREVADTYSTTNPMSQAFVQPSTTSTAAPAPYQAQGSSVQGGHTIAASAPDDSSYSPWGKQRRAWNLLHGYDANAGDVRGATVPWGRQHTLFSNCGPGIYRFSGFGTSRDPYSGRDRESLFDPGIPGGLDDDGDVVMCSGDAWSCVCDACYQARQQHWAGGYGQ